MKTSLQKKNFLIVVIIIRLYQSPPKEHRSRHLHSHKEPKVDLSPFYEKENVDEYLDWEMKVEQLYEC